MSHLSRDDLARWRRGEVTGDSVLAIGHHLGECHRCAELASGEVHLAASLRALNDQFATEVEHPDSEGELLAYAEGTLLAEHRDRIDAHLVECTRCREDLADLRGVFSARPRPSRRWILALAAGLALVVTAAVLFRFERTATTPAPVEPAVVRRTTPPVAAPPSRFARAEWAQAVEGLRSGASLDRPRVLDALRRKPDVLRGDAAPQARLEPVGVVLANARPRFTWTAPAGALSTVTIFDGEREVARSTSLRGRVWTPPRALVRGVTYTWQVDVESHGETNILPMPPAPPARFHIAGQAIVTELEAARRLHPDDHLLLAVLQARAGFDREARAELARVHNPNDAALAKRLLRELETWP